MVNRGAFATLFNSLNKWAFLSPSMHPEILLFFGHEAFHPLFVLTPPSMMPNALFVFKFEMCSFSGHIDHDEIFYSYIPFYIFNMKPYSDLVIIFSSPVQIIE